MAQKPRCHKCGAIVKDIVDDHCRKCGAKLRKTVQISEEVIMTIEQQLAQKNRKPRK